MSLKWPNKDPDEVLDYSIDWIGTSAEPGPLFDTSDTISTSTWIVPDGITRDTDSHTNTKTTIWLSGGTALVTYSFVNRIVTAGARTFDQTVKIKIKTK